MVDLARLLIAACDEVLVEGGEPEYDIAVTIISGRISFLSPADTMNAMEWDAMVASVARGESGNVKLNQEILN